MTDHLTECPMKPIAEAPVDFHQHFPDCIFPALRACEQRVLTEAPVSVFVKAFYAGQSVGFDKGVHAAREAIVNADPYWKVETDEDESVFVMEVSSALAAIGALLEKP